MTQHPTGITAAKRIESDDVPSQKTSLKYARRLKEAGYPQEILYGAYYFTEESSRAHIAESDLTPLFGARQFWKAPTVYELMCACLGVTHELVIEARNDNPELAAWMVQAGGQARVGLNLADNLADIWLELCQATD